MLIAKISPASKTYQRSNTLLPTEITLEYMIVQADPYELGTTKPTGFSVFFGRIEEENGSTVFRSESRIQVDLSAEDLADWGTNDLTIFEKIATKIGTTIVESVII